MTKRVTGLSPGPCVLFATLLGLRLDAVVPGQVASNAVILS